MAGPSESELGLTGWRKTFNSTTLRGRLHLGYASIAFWSLVFLGIKFRPKKKQQTIEQKS